MYNIQNLKNILKNVSQTKNIEFNILLRFYMYDRFIERLSKSSYNKKFILKGGFYLSSLFGINNRSTMDIYTMLNNANMDESTIRNLIENIINIDLKDSVNFKIYKIENIKDLDKYGGYRVTINFKLENIKDSFHIDIATGD